jgi:CheY-like chemotaxis protein
LRSYFCVNRKKNIRVLAVEDLQSDRLIIKKQLGREFCVTTLSSESEAIAFAGVHEFDIALINLMLKEDLDGVRLLEKLKQIRQNDFWPIAITCYVDPSRYTIAMRAGFQAVMMKPFDLHTFKMLTGARQVIAQAF